MGLAWSANVQETCEIVRKGAPFWPLMALLQWLMVCSPGCGPRSPVNVCQVGPGQLVITEIMPDPRGKDEGQEWVEMYNASDRTLDLYGVALAAAASDGSAQKKVVLPSLKAKAGQYLVLGDAPPGEAPQFEDYSYGGRLGGGFRNGGGIVELRCGAQVIDRVVYGEAEEGHSLAFDGNARPDAEDNDQSAAWCVSRTKVPGIEDMYGTPGMPNEPCSGLSDRCWEGDHERPVVPAGPGDLLITEVMADPDAVSDTHGEWVEVFVAEDVDMNGVALGKPGDEANTVVASSQCLRMEAGTYVVFARDLSPESNGGIQDVFWKLGFGLPNSGATLVISRAGEVIDQVSYHEAPKGRSWSLDPGYLDAKSNDSPYAWCEANTPYGDGDMGTPAEENPKCYP